MKIDISVNLSEDDHVKISKEIFQQRRKFWGLFIKVVKPVILVSTILLFIYEWVKEDSEKSVRHELIEMILILLVLYLPPWVRDFQSRMNYRSHKTMHSMIHYFIDDDKIQIQTKYSESKLTWEAIFEVLETKDFFLILQTKFNAITLPKTSLTSEQKNWLKSKVKK